MDVSGMVNEIFTCDSLDAEGQTSRELCNKFAEKFFDETGIRLTFCILHGKRWAYFSGFTDSPAAGQRLQINESLGILADRNDLTDSEWTSLSEALRKIYA